MQRVEESPRNPFFLPSFLLSFSFSSIFLPSSDIYIWTLILPLSFPPSVHPASLSLITSCNSFLFFLPFALSLMKWTGRREEQMRGDNRNNFVVSSACSTTAALSTDCQARHSGLTGTCCVSRQLDTQWRVNNDVLTPTTTWVPAESNNLWNQTLFRLFTVQHDWEQTEPTVNDRSAAAADLLPDVHEGKILL